MSMVMLPLFWINCGLLGLGYFIEGMRIHQISYIIGFIIHSCFAWMTDQTKAGIISGVGLSLLAVSVMCLVWFGESDLSRLQMTGPFEVGHREFRSSKLGNEVSVFYPVDKEHY